jgi:hypothetical protein
MRTYLALSEPIGIYPFFDKIQFWVREPLDQKAIKSLRKECGKDRLFIVNGPAPFGQGFIQRVELRQPSKKALRWLARHNGALINRAEITLDLTFKYRANVEEVWDFLYQHLVRRWHRRRQGVRTFRSTPRDDNPGAGETRYDAGGQDPNLLVFYVEDHSRITGEPNCLHLEWRVKNLRATRAAGIESGRDLLNTTRHEGYGMSQSRRAMTECIFGWGKQHGTMRKTKHRGRARVAADFLLNLIVYNLIRIPKLLAA